MAFAALTIDLNARMAKFEQDMARANKSLDGLSSRASAAASGLKTAFGALAGTLAVGTIASFAKSGIDAADALAKMSVRTGVAVKDLASFQLAADSADTSMEGVAKGLGKLNRSIGEAEAGNKLIADSLKQLGITAKDPREAFYQLADATERIQDPTKRAYLLNNVLGKSYEELVPLLAQGGNALRQSASDTESFADAMARLAPEAEKFNDNITELKHNIAGFAAQLIGPVVTSLNTVFDRFQRLNALPTATFFEKLTGQVSANLPSSIANVNGKIRDLESDIARLTQNSGGADASILPLKQELARLKQLKSELRTLSLSEAMKIADEQYKKAPASAGGSIDTSAATKATRTRTASDPLAGLLASTDIVRMAEFDKQVALLNARFDGGRKNAELYAQAMTKLVEATFSGNFAEYNKQLDSEAETQRLVAEHLKATNDALYEQNQAWIEAGRAIEEQYKTPLQKLDDQLSYLDELMRRGVISVDAYGRAYADAFDQGNQQVDKAKSAFEEFGLTMASAFEDAIAGGKSFSAILKGLEQDILKMVTRKVFTEPLGNALSGALGNGGGLSNLFSSLFGGFRAEGGPLQQGRWYIAGERGPEPVWGGGPGAYATGYPAGGGMQVHNTFYLSGPADSRSQAQVALAAARGVQRAMARNG